MIDVGISAAFCVMGCFIAVLFGRLTRNSEEPKFLRALIASILLSWVFVGGAHGGIAILPVYFIIFCIPIIFAEPFGNDDIALVQIAIFVSIIVFFSYWLAARAEPSKRTPK
jgi:hypothetical protein